MNIAGEIRHVEFAESNNRAHRKTHSHGRWTLEYAVLSSPAANSVGLTPIGITFGFHGFARPLEDFLAVVPHWPEEDCLIAIHLLHHGSSGPSSASQPTDMAIEPWELDALLEEIALVEAPHATRRRMLGYSIGGRVALTLLVFNPKKWDLVVLMAPDGLKKAPLYQLTVHTRLGRWMWFYIDRHSDRILRWNDRLLSWRLISKHLHGFGEFHIKSHEMRMMVWNGWRAHRSCWPSHRAIHTACQQTTQPIHLFFGLHDQIIPPGNGQRLKRMTHALPHVHFHHLSSGHAMLKDRILDEVVQRIFPA